MSSFRTPPLASDVDSATRVRTRNRILDATKKLLTGGEPLAKLSIHRIAQTTGISRATFYLHFQSKHDLITRLAQRETSPWVELAAPVLAEVSITREEMTRVARAAIDVYRVNRGVLAGIIEMAEYDAETREAWRETIHGIANLFQAAIERWRPLLDPAEAKQLARMTVWAGERFLHQEVSDAAGDDDEVMAWTLAEMAWNLMTD